MKNADWEVVENFDLVPLFKHGALEERAKLIKGKSLEALIQGPNRAKYFYYRSSKDFNTRKDEDSSVSAVEIPLAHEAVLQEPIQPATVCTGTQTDYRDGECQTDPWDPPYKLKKGSKDLEILTLVSYKYGKSLPVGEEELEEIVRNREKRQFESLLPPAPTDKNEYRKWRRAFKEQKTKEANLAKSKIKEHHKEQLVTRQLALVQSARERDERKNRILDKMWAKKKDELSDKVFKLRKQFSRKLQRLDRKCLALKKKHDTLPDPLDHVDLSKTALSDTDLCCARETEILESQPKNFYLDTAQGLVELERWLWEEQKMVMEPEIYLPKKDSHPARLQKIMEQAERAILEKKIQKPVISKTEKSCTLEKEKVRPATPTVAAIPQEVLDRTDAATVLQKVLKGRALQKELIEIHNKYISLIEEMHKTQAGLEHEQAAMDERKRARFLEYLELRNVIREKCIHDEILSRFEGRAISNILNIMSHSVDRHVQLKEIEQYINKAKDVRRCREAEEAGRRQKEFENKEILELFIKNVNTEQQGIVKSLLNRVVEEVEKSEAEVDDETVIKELLDDIIGIVEEQEVEMEDVDVIRDLINQIITEVEAEVIT